MKGSASRALHSKRAESACQAHSSLVMPKESPELAAEADTSPASSRASANYPSRKTSPGIPPAARTAGTNTATPAATANTTATTPNVNGSRACTSYN